MTIKIITHAALAAVLYFPATSFATDQPVNGGGGSCNFSSNSSDEWIAGIDYARIRWGNWRDDGTIAFVVWTDFGGAGGCSGGENNGSVHGHFKMQSGKGVEYQCVINGDTKNDAIVTIDDQAFQLTKGNLFLVSTTTGKTIIRQLKRDLASFNAGCDGFKKIAETDSELQDFFQDPKAEK